MLRRSRGMTLVCVRLLASRALPLCALVEAWWRCQITLEVRFRYRVTPGRRLHLCLCIELQGVLYLSGQWQHRLHMREQVLVADVHSGCLVVSHLLGVDHENDGDERELLLCLLIRPV